MAEFIVSKLRWFGCYSPPTLKTVEYRGMLTTSEAKRLDLIRANLANGSRIEAFAKIADSGSGERQFKGVHLPKPDEVIREWHPTVRRTSKVIITKPAKYKKGERPPSCVKCGTEVRPGFCHTGQVLESAVKIPIEMTEFDPSMMEDRTWIAKIPIGKYVNGLICDDCASDYHSTTVEANGKTKTFRNVLVNAIQAVPPKDDRVGFKSNKGFNTRVTR